ncbi:antiviral reverse transcriptase Drt3b [Flagellimonas meridianipacifica]|uniref:Reverse transcriptase (RNA-dependent DNA polymerase) n=1 Tax=Flagellimonas meridianipacifica TaxID=1080225 RepID=A0A2T0MCR1_9FLAO|nr:antiviral reverse transcriptase Drt3b [Allomuricauda pacifica]PRX55270.1 reverse transcriptase (RNA-dependent DNA polymerase) [Allomuricauda pacifica]
MRRKTGNNIGYKKERIVLSDILPYEVPPFFSNRHFYNFLVKNNVVLNEQNRTIQFKKDHSGILKRLIEILFGIDKNVNFISNTEFDSFNFNEKTFNEKLFLTIPFKFKITHKNNDYRELTVIHPVNQLYLVGFYDKYKNTILYNTKLSRFSLRRPSKVSSLKFYKDNTNKKKKSKNQDIEIIETTDKEYTSLKTFFSYQKYSNIYEFYESYEYQRAEKRFDNLVKFDISRCFDSIYTHTLSWALSNKKIVKDNLHTNKNSFGGKFDRVMQQMNYNETNGIVIGPEFSRIFAELILQRIDKNVEKELYRKGHKYKKDYDVYRYVDDFFVFYNDDKIKSEIIGLYKIKLQEYNLFFNDSKTKIIPKPIITNITIAKEEIRGLVEHSMLFQFYDSEIKKQIGLKYYTAKDIITNYKAILAKTETSYKDLQNYFLAIIFNKLKSLIKKIQDEQENLLRLYAQKRDTETRLNDEVQNEVPKYQEKLDEILEEIKEQEKKLKSYHNQLFKNINEIIELTFFIYSVLPRVTYSIKVCHILYRIIDFVKNQERTKQRHLMKVPDASIDEIKYIAFDFDKKHNLYKKIYDGISLVFQKSLSSEYAEVETLYLIQIINELGENYRFEEDSINKHFRVFHIDNQNVKTLNASLNYFTIISLLNYINVDINKKYDTLRTDLRSIIIEKFNKFEKNNAEDIFLLIDVLTCPYVGSTDAETKEFRRQILDKIKFFDAGTSIADKDLIIGKIASYTSDWFYSWKENDLGKELNTKRGHSVY